MLAEGVPVTRVRASAAVIVDRAERAVAEAREVMAEELGRAVPRVPALAFREMLLNAVTHRSYCRGEDIRIELERGLTRIVSPGRPKPMAVSITARTRNPALAAALDVLDLKNGMVRNIRDSVSLYKNC